MSYKAKRQIREIKEAEEASNYRVWAGLVVSGWLLFSVLIYFAAFLLFGGHVK